MKLGFFFSAFLSNSPTCSIFFFFLQCNQRLRFLFMFELEYLLLNEFASPISEPDFDPKCYDFDPTL